MQESSAYESAVREMSPAEAVRNILGTPGRQGAQPPERYSTMQPGQTPEGPMALPPAPDCLCLYCFVVATGIENDPGALI